MSSTFIVYSSLAVAYLVTAIGFIYLNDLSQMFVEAPRKAYMTAFKWRYALIIISFAAFLFAMIMSYRTHVWGWMGISLHSVVFILFFVAAFFLLEFIMFPTKQSGAKFASVADAAQYLGDEDKLWVLEINDDVRAFPHIEIAQPHVIGDIIGGEDVVMTFCDLSHLGIAYSPYIDNKKLEFSTFTQLKNNLVLYDRNTGEPVQQIYGTTEYSKKSMRRYPTQLMTYATLKEIYPNARVLHNPPGGIKDKIVRKMLFYVDNIQHNRDMPPVFPTIDVDDPGLKRLHPKDLVWGVSFSDQQTAYTYDYLEENNWIINTQVGGKDILLVYYPEYKTVGSFDPNIDGQTITITDLGQIDVYGNTSSGKLSRVPIASEVFWMVWYTFYPDTKINA